MTESSPPPPTKPLVNAARVISGICLVIPFVAMLWVSSYAKNSPEFIGIPFFYWYQMAWVLGSSVLTSIAYVLISRDEKARRQTGVPVEGDAA